MELMSFTMNSDLAYVVGVYLGDGYACKTNGRFVHKSTDLEFVEETRSRFKKLFNRNPKIYVDGKYFNNRHQMWINVYAFEFSNRPLVNWLLEETKGKTIIPNSIIYGSKEEQIQFLAGFFSSEGSVKPNGIDTIYARIECTGLFTPITYKMFNYNNMHTGKLITRTLRSGKTCYRYNIKVADMKDFPIYVSEKKWAIEWYHNPQRLNVEPSKEVMLQSDLTGDSKNTSEMKVSV